MRPVSSEFIRYDIGACGPGLQGLLLVADRGRGLCAILMGDDEGALAAGMQEKAIEFRDAGQQVYRKL